MDSDAIGNGSLAHVGQCGANLDANRRDAPSVTLTPLRTACEQLQTDVLSQKQRIYSDILERVLPFIRNIQRHSAWRRLRYGSFYPELELVHNIHRLLVEPEFTEHDIYWLNCQARLFVEHGENPIHGFYRPIVSCISEMFSLVPEELKDKLTWVGP